MSQVDARLEIESELTGASKVVKILLLLAWSAAGFLCVFVVAPALFDGHRKEMLMTFLCWVNAVGPLIGAVVVSLSESTGKQTVVYEKHGDNLVILLRTESSEAELEDLDMTEVERVWADHEGLHYCGFLASATGDQPIGIPLGVSLHHPDRKILEENKKRVVNFIAQQFPDVDAG